MHLKAHKVMNAFIFSTLTLFPCKLYDQLSPNVHMFVILCMDVGTHQVRLTNYQRNPVPLMEVKPEDGIKGLVKTIEKRPKKKWSERTLNLAKKYHI